MAGRPTFDLACEQIVDAAIAILNERGLDAVSMRSVGERLGVSPIPVYARIGNKEALLEAMTERFLAGMAPATSEGEPWQRYAKRWAAAVRERMLGSASVLLALGARRGPFIDASRPLIDVLRAQGFTADEAVQACRLLVWAIIGFAVVENSRGTSSTRRTGRRRPGSDPAGITPREADLLFELHVDFVVSGIDRDGFRGRRARATRGRPQTTRTRKLSARRPVISSAEARRRR